MSSVHEEDALLDLRETKLAWIWVHKLLRLTSFWPHGADVKEVGGKGGLNLLVVGTLEQIAGGYDSVHDWSVVDDVYLRVVVFEEPQHRQYHRPYFWSDVLL